MLSYILIFTVFIFFLRIPLFFLRLIFRFAKPLSLIGLGCVLGSVVSTGWPDLSQLDFSSVNTASHSRPSDLSEPEEPIGPKIIEAALDLADRAGESLSVMLSDAQDAWGKASASRALNDKQGQDQDQKLAGAQKSTGHDFNFLAGSLWDRKKQR